MSVISHHIRRNERVRNNATVVPLRSVCTPAWKLGQTFNSSTFARDKHYSTVPIAVRSTNAVPVARV